MKIRLTQFLFLFLVIFSLSGFCSSPLALFLGFVFVQFRENPFDELSKKMVKHLLKIAIIGLGFGMSLSETIQTSKEGFLLTFFSICLVFLLGLSLTKLLALDKKLGFLITSGTAICGGSAIAAVSAVIKPKHQQISIALGIVFLLNSIALFIFPSIGHFLALSQKEFGLWAAVAIHDTSSVVGATLSYGEKALQIGTTVKLARTLWIIPLSFFSLFLFKTEGQKIKIPFFIVGFLLAISLNSLGIFPTALSSGVVAISKRLLILTLFLVGTSLSLVELKKEASDQFFLP